jgi:hypothetical protein
MRNTNGVQKARDRERKSRALYSEAPAGKKKSLNRNYLKFYMNTGLTATSILDGADKNIL